MKIRTSYFYQIRNFTRNMIPISTAVWDPTWYHNFTNDYNYIFKDKRNILNGLRLESIIEQGKKSNNGPDVCPCDKKDYQTCSFLKQYRENLEKINFDKMITEMEELAKNYKAKENIQEEIILVLIVYETPLNFCSERIPLQEYFTNHGWECKELDYPIKNIAKIPLINKPFDF